MILTPTERAKQIDLGDGTFCCDRSVGGICYAHQQIADAIKKAVKLAQLSTLDYAAIVVRETNTKGINGKANILLAASNTIRKVRESLYERKVK